MSYEFEATKEYLVRTGTPINDAPQAPGKNLRATLLREEIEHFFAKARAAGQGPAVARHMLTLLIEHCGLSEFTRHMPLTIEAPAQADLAAFLEASLLQDHVGKQQLLTYGLASYYKQGFDLVHTSQMSKLCLLEEQAEEGLRQQAAENLPAQSVRVQVRAGVTPLYHLRRAEDNRVLINPLTYKAADLNQLLYGRKKYAAQSLVQEIVRLINHVAIPRQQKTNILIRVHMLTTQKAERNYRKAARADSSV